MGGPDHVDVGPPPKLLSVRVTPGYDATLAPLPLTKLADGVTVMNTTQLVLKFDRFLLPGAAIRQAICLHPPSTTVARPEDCDDSVFSSARYDPVNRTVTYFLSARLPANQLFQLTVFRGNGDFGIRAFDGVPLDQNYEFNFTPTGAPAAVVVEAPPTANGFCAPGSCGDGCPGGAGTLLDGSCNGCHAPGGQDLFGKKLEPAMGLRLNTMEGLTQTAIGKVAHGSQEGGAARVPADSPDRFGVRMAIVQPGEPGQSYLLYKLLANEALAIAIDPNDPDDLALAPGEIGRLRSSVVTGVPMPATSTYTFSHADAEQVSQWIAAGALLPISSDPQFNCP